MNKSKFRFFFIYIIIAIELVDRHFPSSAQSSWIFIFIRTAHALKNYLFRLLDGVRFPLSHQKEKYQKKHYERIHWLSDPSKYTLLLISLIFWIGLGEL